MKFLVNGKGSFSCCIDTLLLQIKHENLKKNELCKVNCL